MNFFSQIDYFQQLTQKNFPSITKSIIYKQTIVTVKLKSDINWNYKTTF